MNVRNLPKPIQVILAILGLLAIILFLWGGMQGVIAVLDLAAA